ncbi:MAG: TlpA family protein disulfide reductase [Eudoraea sp.]|nr:TlpA family protein disulfide reductase [Eudoraea sp.]
MKKKPFSRSSILFVVCILLLIIPQTRKPIQVALNTLRVAVWSPGVLDADEQTQLLPFTYKVRTLDGTPLEAAIGKGTVTFISYWATWCPPCIAELPSIQELYTSYGDQIQFLLITNETPEVVKRFLDKKNYDLPVVFPRMQPPKELFERSIPTNYLIDQHGNIIIKEKGASNWNSASIRAIVEDVLKR